ncbi:MAG: hypothetical protein HUU21_10865 [Polyangiaceae bacterium]|nr:hypothetical protein [Polyangiaceae bacterium]
MSNGATDGAGSPNVEKPAAAKVMANVSSLEELVGAHPEALQRIYERGRPADPVDLGDEPRGRVLALGPFSDAFMLLRPVIRALATDAFPWRGKVFDHGGNSGENVVFGKKMLRFRAEVGPSEVDGAPTLVLRYGEPSYKNPWPVRAIVDELRSVGRGVAIGPAYFTNKGERYLMLWFGLQREG